MLILIVILSIVLTLFILKSLKSTLKKYDFGFYYIDKVQEQIEAQKIQDRARDIVAGRDHSSWLRA